MCDCRNYWLRILDPRWRAAKSFFMKNIHIIDGINFRKSRLPNTHLLTAIFCGHFSKFTSTLWAKKKSSNPAEWTCSLCDQPYGEDCYDRLGTCPCNLAIPGVVPAGRPFQPEHYEFLRYLNKLSRHESFEMFRKDKPYPMDGEVVDRYEWEYDGTLGCLNVYTDGSCKNGRASYGVYYESHPGLVMNSALFGPVEGKQTNNTGELAALLMAIRYAKDKWGGPLHLHTDSLYYMKALTMYRRCNEKDIVEECKVKYSILNLDIIKNVMEQISLYPGRIYITKVPAHSDCIGNNIADQLAGLYHKIYF